MAVSPEAALEIATLACSVLSLLGSIFVACSYLIARTKSKPRTAQLIVNLSATDFFWFLATAIASAFWINETAIPEILCMVIAPTIVFTRSASLVWTCAISFDVYMSVNKRKWLWRDEESRWIVYRRFYIGAVLLASAPVMLYTMYEQQAHPNFGCVPASEFVNAYIILFCEIIPLACGYIWNVVVFFLVRKRMANR